MYHLALGSLLRSFSSCYACVGDWKALEDKGGWLCLLNSLPYVVGFAKTLWCVGTVLSRVPISGGNVEKLKNYLGRLRKKQQNHLFLGFLQLCIY